MNHASELGKISAQKRREKMGEERYLKFLRKNAAKGGKAGKGTKKPRKVIHLS